MIYLDKLLIKKILINFSIFCFSINIYCQNLDVIPEFFGEEIIINSKKSLSKFKFKLPNGFKYLRDGKDNTTIKVYRKDINTGIQDLFGNDIIRSIEFSVTSMKLKDNRDYKIFINKSYPQIVSIIKSNIEKSQNKIIETNDFVELYETKNSVWIIGGSWSEEKRIYTVIATQLNSQNLNQLISFVFFSNYRGNKSLDIKNFKKLINTFKFH